MNKSAFAGALFVWGVTAPAMADTVTKYKWPSNEQLYDTALSACTDNYELNDTTCPANAAPSVYAYTNSWLGTIPYGSSGAQKCQFERVSERCATGVTTTGTITLNDIVSAVEVEEDDPVTCEALEGVQYQYDFSYYFDGDPPNMGGLSCVNGCEADVLVNTTTEYSNYGDGWEPSVEHYAVTQDMTGAECGGDAGEPPETPPGISEKDENNTCTADYYTSPTTGSIVCGKPPTTTADDNGTTTTTESNEDGTETTTVTTPDGTTTQTTQHPDGSTTTTTTTAGGQTSTEYSNDGKSDDDEDEDECPSNQYTLVNGNLQCKSEEGEGDGTVSGGSCDAEPSCDGDPILCAILMQAWNQRCNAQLPTESEILVETGLDTFGVDALVDGEIGVAESFDDTGVLSESTCPVPLSVNVNGVALEFSFDPLCTLAGYISPFVILSGLFAGTRIVIGAI